MPVHKLKHFFVILSFCQQNPSTTAAGFKKKVCLRIVDRPLKQIPENLKILISKHNIENLH